MKCVGICLIVLSSLTACGKSEDDKNDAATTITPGAGKLPVASLAKPSGLADLARTEVIDAMESNRWDFLATEAEAPEETEPTVDEGEVDCFGDAFSSIEVVAEDDKLFVDANIDLTTCLKTVWSQGAEGVTADISKAQMSIYIEQTCVGADLSSFNGKKLDEMEDPPECDSNRTMMNMTSEMIAKMSANGQTVDVNSKTVNAISTEANEPCLMTKSGTNYSEDGCVEIFMSVGPDGSDDNEYSKYKHNNLKWVDSAKNTWYTSGSIDVELNDWAGSVTFGGAAVNPTYSLQKGAETVNGTLTTPSGLYFKNSLQRAVMRGMPRVKKGS